MEIDEDGDRVIMIATPRRRVVSVPIGLPLPNLLVHYRNGTNWGTTTMTMAIPMTLPTCQWLNFRGWKIV